ncbi:hypothetical protein X942_3288 [Burkholderia pseudomallei MSHR5596]|nr:hypothetical protein X942_3288 [Burkholderia pseudomallei MSHR5596]
MCMDSVWGGESPFGAGIVARAAKGAPERHRSGNAIHRGKSA